MKKFVRKNLTRAQRIRIYRFFYTLNEIDFSFLRPIFTGALLFFAVLIGFTLPDSVIAEIPEINIIIYYLMLIILSAAVVMTLQPFVHHRILRIRIWFYRRRKKPTFSIFS